MNYTQKPKKYVFDINFNGDQSAGLRPYSDIITVFVDSGDLGGEDGEFENQIHQALQEWYDEGTCVMRYSE